MKYELLGKEMPVVEMELTKGETVYTQSGGMVWQSEGIKMETNTKGGFLKGFSRMFAGESFFMVTYKAEKDATIAFASSVPGSIMPIDVSEHRGMVLQKGAFLCAEDSVELSTILAKRLSAGMFGGEGFVLQQIDGNGTVFLEVDGDPIVKELAPGEVIKVDTGNVVAFDSTVQYEVETIKGMGNILFGGEGLFLTKLTGPGKVVLQTMSMNELAGKIASYIPAKSGK